MAMESRREALCSVSVEVLPYCERLVIYRLVIATPRTPDAVSPRQYPPKKYRLAITTLRTPDARSAQSNIVIVRFQSYAPTLRCRCVATPRLVANKDYVTMPLASPSKRLRCLCEMFSVGYSLGAIVNRSTTL